jgi:tetratricopeptide (TPR) repeat protein
MSIEPITTQFIGREQEIGFFKQWVINAGEPSIIFLHDKLEKQEKKGGIGKTYLLKEFVKIVKSTYQACVVPVSLDFFNVADRDGVVIAERLVAALQERFSYWVAERFQRIFDEYQRMAHGQMAAMANLRARLRVALVDDLYLLQAHLIENDIFILLVFDTFEQIEHNPITAVLQSAHPFPDTYESSRIRVVIAGRNPIDWSHQNWVGREREVTVRALPPFDYDETIRYWSIHSYVYEIDDLPENLRSGLYERTEGRPILVGLVTDVLNKRIRTPKALTLISKREFEACLVEEINDFDDPSRWAILAMAHIYHRFNRELLDLLMNTAGLEGLVPEMQYQELQEALPQLSFVRRSTSSDDFVLHDEMRRLVNRYCWEKQDPDAYIRSELSVLAVKYYTQLLMEEQQEDLHQSYIAEMLFHKLFLDIDDGFGYFKEHFEQASTLLLLPFARALLQEVQAFTKKLSHEQYLQLRFAEAGLLLSEANPREALEIYRELERDERWADGHRSDLLYEKSQCYLKMNRFKEAEDSIKEYLVIEENRIDQVIYAKLFTTLGYICRRRGMYSEAMNYYQKSLRLQSDLDSPEAANLQNNLSNVYRLQNNLEMALHYCKLALRTRRRLYREGRMSENMLGFSLNLLGHIYHEMGEIWEEEKAYQEAFEIYRRADDRSSLAATYNCLGRILIRKGEYDSALAKFELALRIGAEINRETEIESLYQQGCVYVVRGKWWESIPYFEKAAMLARQVGQSFQHAQNLLYLAIAQERSGQSSSELIREVKRISRRNEYHGLLGKLAEMHADIYYERHDYARAFRQYRVACYYNAKRGPLEFNRFLRKLDDVLLEIPKSFLPTAIDALLEYWFDVGMEESHPQLLDICRGVSLHTVL